MPMMMPELLHDDDRSRRPEDAVRQPPTLSGGTRYRFRDWWRSKDGMRLFRVRLGTWWEYWRNGWSKNTRYAYPLPGHVFQWGGKIPEAWYYVKCRVLPWKRYNTVVVRTEPPTWQSRGDFLLPLLMEVLTDFVEKERPFEHFDTSYHFDAWWSIRDLYEWWHVRRPERLAREQAAMDAWHAEFRRLGGMTPGPDEGDDTRQMLFPQDRGEDVTEERRLSRVMRELEEAGEREDEAMMIRLIRLRGHLWT